MPDAENDMSMLDPDAFGAAGYLLRPPAESGLQRRLYEVERRQGWGDTTFGEECAHLHEEVAEAFREWRLHKDAQVRYAVDGKPTGVPIELADVVIGCFYNAEALGFDLMAAVEEKHAYNATRDYVAEGRQLHPRTGVMPPGSCSADGPCWLGYDHAGPCKPAANPPGGSDV